MSLAKNIDFLRRLPKLNGFNGFGELGGSLRPDSRSPLAEITDFGSNPGALRMFSFVPEHLQQPPALVVVLHGCGQTAAGYDLGAGWSTLARHYGFALLMPQQQSSNNGNTCFNWFNPEDITRDQGEACSIRQMIGRMADDAGIDQHRIYVTGLSAGGAMTSVMLATYPELFAGGAIIAGLPYGVATNLREALAGMSQSAPRPAAALGDLVRNASSHKGSWPRLSVWHGSADRTVNPGNANEIVKQWLDVHQLPLAPMSESEVDGYPRQVWWNQDGETIVESYTITDMSHGTPLGLADNEEHYGAQGAFLIEAGISSSHHIASFFGLTDWIAQGRETPAKTAEETAKDAVKATTKKPVREAVTPSSKQTALVAPEVFPVPDLAAVLWPRAMPVQAKSSSAPRRRGIDVGEVITRALTAAGLMK